METEVKTEVYGWYIIEFTGKNNPVLAGLISEEYICNTSFLRIDVPEVNGFDCIIQEGFTKLINPRDISMLTPATMELCRRMAQVRKFKPLTIYLGEMRKEDICDT